MTFTFKNCVYDKQELEELQAKDKATEEKKNATKEANKAKKKTKTKPKK